MNLPDRSGSFGNHCDGPSSRTRRTLTCERSHRALPRGVRFSRPSLGMAPGPAASGVAESTVDNVGGTDDEATETMDRRQRRADLCRGPAGDRVRHRERRIQWWGAGHAAGRLHHRGHAGTRRLPDRAVAAAGRQRLPGGLRRVAEQRPLSNAGQEAAIRTFNAALPGIVQATAGTSAITGWTVTWTCADGQTVTQPAAARG